MIKTPLSDQFFVTNCLKKSKSGKIILNNEKQKIKHGK